MKQIIISCCCFLSLALVISGCATQKLPAGDIEVMQKYRTEVEILRDPKIKANTKIKFEAAKVIVDNVDFSYARSWHDLEEIFGFNDVVGKTRYGGKKSLVFKYSWQDQVIEVNVFFSGHSVTRVNVKETTFDASAPRKIKSFNRIQNDPNAEWKTDGGKQR